MFRIFRVVTDILSSLSTIELICLGVCMLAVLWIVVFIKLREMNDEEMKNKIDKPQINKNEMNKAEEKTQKLMIETLKAIGCQPTINDDDIVEVCFQGESFIMTFAEKYVQIGDIAWMQINENEPGLPLLREAINKTNFDFGPAVVITAPTEEGTRYVHSLYSILFIPEIPHIEDYLKASLVRFFHKKNDVRETYMDFVKEYCNNALLE